MADSKKIIDVNSLIKKGASCEEIEDFGQSIFSDVYQRASAAVMQIVEDNREKRRENAWGRTDVEIPNVVSFVGRRGTGKTTSMLSFLNALRASSVERMESAGFGVLDKIKKEHIYFHAIDYIDVSMMNTSDDIFVLVLGNLLGSIEYAETTAGGQMDDFLRRDILQQMEKIYAAVRTQNNVEGEKIDAYSAYEKLRHVNSGQRIRKMFAHLVEDYLVYMQQLADRRIHSSEEQYLVVAIDDIDMCENNSIRLKSSSSRRAYEMINTLFRYMSVPGVIILCSFHEERLYGKCVAHFAEQDTQHTFDRRSYFEQAKSHMEKTFSPVYRIYMPSWRKRDYHEYRFYVDVQKSDIIIRILQILICGSIEEPLEIKPLIMLLYAGAAGVYFDPAGQKIHFIEPDSLRELNNNIHFLIDPFQELDWDNPDHIKTVRMNILKNIKDDIYFRFFEEKIYKSEERDWFRMLSRQKIARRSEEIVRTVAPRIQPLGYVDEKTFDVLGGQQITRIALRSKDNSNVPYSFAELVHCIYHMTRLKDAYSQELVVCILYSYSVYLNQLYEEYREECQMKSKDSEEESPYNEKYEILKGVLGRTVCGRWSEYFMAQIANPHIQNGVSHTVSIGYIGNTHFAYELILESGKEEQRLQQTIHSAVREMTFLFMLHVDWDFWNTMTINYSSEADEGRIQISCVYDKTVEVDMTMFLKYSFCHREFFGHFRDFWDAILPVDMRNRKDEGMVKKSIDELESEFVAWEKEFGSLALPIQNFDLMYNLIKRMHQEGKVKNVERIIAEDDFEEKFWEEYDAMLDDFRRHLMRIDEYYHPKDNEEMPNDIIPNGFCSIFNACPFIRLFEEIRENEGSRRRIITYLMNMIENEYQEQNLMTDADDKVKTSQQKQNVPISLTNEYVSKK